MALVQGTQSPIMITDEHGHRYHFRKAPTWLLLDAIIDLEMDEMTTEKELQHDELTAEYMAREGFERPAIQYGAFSI